jgi:hypothetical protein
MSAATMHCAGAGQTSLVQIAALRWNESHPGRWSVFFLPTAIEDVEAGLLASMWEAAVIDDFGNLVRVPQ